MSHYQYQPSTGHIISTLHVNLSYEEMRWEYYQEMDKENLKNSVRHKINDCSNDNKLNRNAKLEQQINSDCDMTSDLDDNLVSNVRETKRRKFGVVDKSFEESEQKIKKMRLSMGSSSRVRSINDEVDMLSTSILNSAKKSRLRRPKLKAQLEKVNQAYEQRLINAIIDTRKFGNEFVKIGDYLAAYDKYTQALEISSKYPQLSALNYSNRAFALMKLNRFEEALVDCNQALATGDCGYKPRLRRIKCLIELERFDEAKKDVDQLKSISNLEECDQLLSTITAKQQYAFAVEKGRQYESTRDFTSALACFNEALDIDYNSSAVLQNRARALYHLGRYRESLADLNEALRLDPTDFAPVYNRVGVLLKLERFQEAIRDAEQLNKRQPTAEHRQLLRAAIEAERKASRRNYYEILEVDRKASVAEIKRQYRRMALVYHPDKLTQADPLTRAQHEDQFKRLTTILHTLTDPVKRSMYDMTL